MPLPSEDEIREFAEKIGALDDTGNYTVSRSKLAAGAQRYREELEKDAEAEQVETTAQQLARFQYELAEQAAPEGLIESIIPAVASALVRRQGLILNPKENPHP